MGREGSSSRRPRRPDSRNHGHNDGGGRGAKKGGKEGTRCLAAWSAGERRNRARRAWTKKQKQMRGHSEEDENKTRPWRGRALNGRSSYESGRREDVSRLWVVRFGGKLRGSARRYGVMLFKISWKPFVGVV